MPLWFRPDNDLNFSPILSYHQYRPKHVCLSVSHSYLLLIAWAVSVSPAYCPPAPRQNMDLVFPEPRVKSLSCSLSVTHTRDQVASSVACSTAVSVCGMVCPPETGRWMDKWRKEEKKRPRADVGPHKQWHQNRQKKMSVLLVAHFDEVVELVVPPDVFTCLCEGEKQTGASHADSYAG